MKRWIFLIFLFLCSAGLLIGTFFMKDTEMKPAFLQFELVNCVENCEALATVEGGATSESLSFAAHYDIRTLDITYEIERPEEMTSFGRVGSGEESFFGKGVIGGEYFDRFEEIVEVLDPTVGMNNSMENFGGLEGSCRGFERFVVKIGYPGENFEELEPWFTGKCGVNGGAPEMFMSFYNDVAILLTEDTY